MSWFANHLLIPIITGIAVGVALRFTAIVGEVGQHDLRAEEINVDLNRWVRDRDRVLNAALFRAINLARQGVIEDVVQPPVPEGLEGTAPGDLSNSGAFERRIARLIRQALHEYRDEASGKLGLTSPKATALRRHLGIDDQPESVHEFHFGGLQLVQYSDNAYAQMKDALEDPNVDMEAIWAEHGFGRGRAKGR